MLATLIAFPAVGVAVLRFRLYEIDRVVSRALVYGSLGDGEALYSASSCYRGDGRAATIRSCRCWAARRCGGSPARAWRTRRIDRLMYGDRDTRTSGSPRLATRLRARKLGPVGYRRRRSAATAVRANIWLPHWLRERAPRRHGRSEHVTVEVEVPGPCRRLAVEERAPGEPFGAADLALLNDLAGQQAPLCTRPPRRRPQRSRLSLVLAREEGAVASAATCTTARPDPGRAVFQVDAAHDLIVAIPDAADGSSAPARRCRTRSRASAPSSTRFVLLPWTS